MIMIVIIVPCYNEFGRINKNSFINFLNKNNNCTLIFSDDGSSDKTLEVLNEIKDSTKGNVHIYALGENKGKAEAIREAVLYCFENKLDFNQLAYLDADLAVSLEECLSMTKVMTSDIFFVFGSRISKIDNNIERKASRHYVGRCIATIISILLEVHVYDTQCGCKLFSYDLASQVFKEKFISRWLFDVEIFFRIINLYSRTELQNRSREIPLKSWIDIDESKVKITYFFRIWYDLYAIKKRYNKKHK